MLKKALGLVLTAVMLLGVFGLTACDLGDLDKYKETKKAELTAYVEALDEDDYAATDWTEIQRFETTGKDNIDAAATKSAVNTALATAKSGIGAILPKEVIVGDYSITVTVDKTTASVGDTVTAKVVFKNLSGSDIEAELPSWIAASGGQDIDDILIAVFTTDNDFGWMFEDILFEPRPVVLIESEAVIERDFEFTITQSGTLEIHTGAFFITANNASSYGMQILGNPIKITVQ